MAVRSVRTEGCQGAKGEVRWCSTACAAVVVALVVLAQQLEATAFCAIRH
jgi:hypothetical protein